MQNTSAWRRTKPALYTLLALACVLLLTQAIIFHQMYTWSLRMFFTGRLYSGDLFRTPGLALYALISALPLILLLCATLQQLKKKTITKTGTLWFLLVYFFCIGILPLCKYVSILGIYMRFLISDPQYQTLRIFSVLALVFGLCCIIALVWFFCSNANWISQIFLCICAICFVLAVHTAGLAIYFPYLSSAPDSTSRIALLDGLSIIPHCIMIVVYIVSVRPAATAREHPHAISQANVPT